MTRLSRIKNTRPGTDSPREFRCGHCRARCTRSPDGKTEYGHMNGCPDRPDEFPNGEHNVKYRDYIDAGDEEIVTDGGID